MQLLSAQAIGPNVRTVTQPDITAIKSAPTAKVLAIFSWACRIKQRFKRATINLLTNYMDSLYWCLNLTPQTRTAAPGSSESSKLVRLLRLANFFGFISFADPHPITPIESYRFEISEGRAYSQLANASHPAKFLSHDTFADPHPLSLYPAIFYKKDGGREGRRPSPLVGPAFPGGPLFLFLTGHGSRNTRHSE
jgi:hypothetical protein